MPGPVSLPSVGLVAARSDDQREDVKHIGSRLTALTDPLVSVDASLVACQENSTAQHAALWSLWQHIAEEAALAQSTAEPALPESNSRRWFVSFQSQSQLLLRANPQMRRASVLLRWLEHCAMAKGTGQARVFSALRAGEHVDAVRIATECDPVLAGLLSAVIPFGGAEAWHSTAAVIPLFGEFKAAVCDHSRRPDNAHRLQLMQNLSRLLPTWSPGFARLVVAHIVGDEPTLMTAFANQASAVDTLWVKLRCVMLKSLAYNAIRLGVEDASAEYKAKLEHDLGVNDTSTWEHAVSARIEKIVSEVTRGATDPVLGSIGMLFGCATTMSSEVQKTSIGASVQLCAHKMAVHGLRDFNISLSTLSSTLDAANLRFVQEPSWPQQLSAQVVRFSRIFSSQQEQAEHLIRVAATCGMHSEFDPRGYLQAVRSVFGAEVSDRVALEASTQLSTLVAGQWLECVERPQNSPEVSRRFTDILRRCWNHQRCDMSPAAAFATKWSTHGHALEHDLQLWTAIARAHEAVCCHTKVAVAVMDGQRRTAALRLVTDRCETFSTALETARDCVLLSTSGDDSGCVSELLVCLVETACLHVRCAPVANVRPAFESVVSIVCEHGRRSAPTQAAAASLMGSVRTLRSALGQRLHDERLEERAA